MTADPIAAAVLERLPEDAKLFLLANDAGDPEEVVAEVLAVLRGLGALHDPDAVPMDVQEMCEELADLAGIARYSRGVPAPRGPLGALASRADFNLVSRAALRNAVGVDAQTRANALVAALDQELRARITDGRARP